MINTKTKIFDAVGGFETLDKVHKVFYDKLYAHPWLGPFFKQHDQAFIEKQQTYFMAEKIGGPKKYLGKAPAYAHQHMFITDELFDVRQELLRESLIETGVNEELIEKWLFVDNAFRQQIVDKDMESFLKPYTFKQRVIVPKPEEDLEEA